MTKYLTLLLLVFSLNQGFSQQDSTKAKSTELQYGGRSGFYFSGFSYGYSFISYFTMGFGIHEFSLGPSFGRQPRFSPERIQADFTNDYTLNGIDFTYRILPNGPGKIFDFYFQIDLFQKWGKASGTDYMFNWPNYGENTTLDLNAKSISSQGFVEFGFDIKFLKYAYVGTAIGIGGRIDNLNFDYGTYSEFNIKEREIESDLIFRANLGMRF